MKSKIKYLSFVSLSCCGHFHFQAASQGDLQNCLDLEFFLIEEIKLYFARLVASVRWSGVLAIYRTFVDNGFLS